jgi:hypothetical protein
VTDSGYDGILVALNAEDGSAMFVSTLVNNNTVYRSDGYGIQLTSGNQYSTVFTYNSFLNNTVSISGFGGMSDTNYVYGGTSLQFSLWNNNDVSDSGAFAGINIVSTNYGNGFQSSLNYLYNNDLTFNYVGIGVYQYSDTDDTQNYQYDLISGNTFTFNAYGIVGLEDLATSNVTQVINVYGLNTMNFNFISDYAFFSFNGGQFVF